MTSNDGNSVPIQDTEFCFYFQNETLVQIVSSFLSVLHNTMTQLIIQSLYFFISFRLSRYQRCFWIPMCRILKRSQLYAPIVRFMFSEFQSVVYKMFSTVCVSQCSVLYSHTLFRRHNTFMFSCLSLFFLFLYIHWVRVRIDAKALSKECLNRWYSVMSGLWVLFYTSNIRVNLKWELG